MPPAGRPAPGFAPCFDEGDGAAGGGTARGMPCDGGAAPKSTCGDPEPGEGRRRGRAAYAAALKSSASGSAVSAFGCKPCRKAAARSAWAAAVKIARLSFFRTRNQFPM